jgi:hypothetical protein
VRATVTRDRNKKCFDFMARKIIIRAPDDNPSFLEEQYPAIDLISGMLWDYHNWRPVRQKNEI